MEAALIAFGVLLGTVMSELSSWWRERRTDRKAARRVRTMINVEIVQNLSLAGDYFDSLKKVYIDDDVPEGYREPEPDNMSIVYVWRLVSLPLPPRRSAMWESQLSELTTALSENQIMQCHRHYGHIVTIATVEATLAGLRAESLSRAERQDEAKTKVITRDRYYRDRYYVEGPELWAQCERAFQLMLGAGNPLADEAERMHTAKHYLSEADQAATADE